MEAYCRHGHRWSVAADTGGFDPDDPLRCPRCQEGAVVVERRDGMEIDFAVPVDVRPVASVLIADEQERRREELARRIESVPDLAVSGHAADGNDVLELATLLRPDVLVVADRMPRMDGLTVLPLLRESAPEAVIVFFCARMDGRLMSTACARGADACIDESEVCDELVPALRRLVHRGHSAHPAVRLPHLDAGAAR